MLPELKSYVASLMKAEPYGLVNDGTSDTSIKEMNGACALICDVKYLKQVEFKFFDMCSTTGDNASTADTIYKSIQGALNQDDVSWSNFVSLDVDNCNTNAGARISIKTQILAENNCYFIAGCSCHSAHSAAGKGGQVDLHYHFKGSTRRKGILAEYVDFVGLGWEDMPRFVTTCCEKELRQHEAFKSMFGSRTGDSSKQGRGNGNEKGSNSRFQRFEMAFADLMSEVHLPFFNAALPLFSVV